MEGRRRKRRRRSGKDSEASTSETRQLFLLDKKTL